MNGSESFDEKLSKEKPRSPKTRGKKSLLSSLIQADKITGQVDLTNLSYRKVIIHVGPVPAVRLCWRAEEVYEEENTDERLPSSTSAPSNPTTSTSQSLLGKTSFFGQRYAQKESAPSSSPKLPSSSDPGTSETGTPSTPTGDWKKDALAKFKVMPGISKYR